MDTSKTCWRGDYGDVKPVEVLRRPGAAMDESGRLRQGYYDTELQAWSGIMASHEEAVNEATKRQQQALATYDGAKRELIERRHVYTQVVQRYDEWRRLHAGRQAREAAAV